VRTFGGTTIRISLVAALLTGAGLTVSSVIAAPAAFNAAGSARQVYATGVPGGSAVTLLDSTGATVATETADAQGGVLFRNVTPGDGYRVEQADGTTSTPVTVHTEDAAPWDPSVYNQTIPDHGYGYLTTRDGTKLAYDVHPPTAPPVAFQGHNVPDNNIPAGPDYAEPYPTLIEYSGYAYADPAGPTSGIAAVANAMGFAVVDIQMRGTGCSGGAFDFFEPLQSLDGYDIVETIARQSWVRGGKVGMMGISYGGISQLFTAATQPPHLAAIAPLSVIDATATTLYPGGVLNTGFAVAWAKERQDQAEPAGPNAGQPYAWKQIQSGDQVCADNQVLHGEAADLMQKIRDNSHYVANVADPLDPVTFVNKINVPVFMVCQFEDEQTGGHCPTLAARMTGTSKKWFTFTNGPHIDSLAPATFNRWYDFMMIYVANQAPALNSAVVQAVAPVVYSTALGTPQNDLITLPPDPIQLQPTVDLAKTAFEALPSVRVLFDNGAGKKPTGDFTAGDPYAQFEKSFASWPVPGTTARSFYLGDGGTLGDSTKGKGVDQYTSDAAALPKTNYGSNTGTGGLWGNASQWDWQWKQNPAGTTVSYLSAPLKSDTAVVGAGALYLWVKSSTPDVDLQATISEVTPDGHETFVQNGYQRASERKLSYDTNNVMHAPSTLLEPVPTMLAADAAPMPATDFVPVAIPLYYEGHVYRAGTRIRVTIAAPNGSQPIWSFDNTEPAGSTASVAIAFSHQMPSRLVLPVLPGVDAAGTPQPACPSLRNEPCRAYVPFVNQSGTANGPRR
jgi:predicted acyl esterase